MKSGREEAVGGAVLNRVAAAARRSCSSALFELLGRHKRGKSDAERADEINLTARVCARAKISFKCERAVSADIDVSRESAMAVFRSEYGRRREAVAN